VIKDNTPLKQAPKKIVPEKDQIEIQRDLAISLASTDSLSNGLHLCLEACLSVSGMDGGGIYLFDDITGSLNLTVHKGLTEQFLKSVLTYDKDSNNVAVVKKGKPIYTSLRDLDPSLLTQAQKHEGFRAFATAPLFEKSNVIGCINIVSYHYDEFPETSGIAVETVAAQAGAAIARLRAKEELKASEEHLRSLMLNAEFYAVYRLAISDTSPNKLEVIFVSPSIVDIMGVTHPDNFDLWFKNIHADDRERIIKANLKAFQTLRFDEEMKIYHPQKKERRWIHAISKGIKNEHGNLKYVNGIILDITQRKRIEETLTKNEKELKAKTLKLESINTALNVLMRQRDEDNTVIQERIVSNVKRVINPYIDMLRDYTKNEHQSHLFETLELNLNDIISSFSLTLSSEKYGLTAKELLVANLIRQGKKTKEIAILNNISHKTVEVHRNSIRKKLGLKGKKVNLQTYLRSHIN
jgi:PAS domain S-box-containing protein